MLAMLLDVASGEVGMRSEFFGAPALVSSAPARIALRTGAWVMPSVVVRGPGDDLAIHPIIDTELRDWRPSGDEARDIGDLTRQIMQSLERTIRAYPDQWFIFRRMWQRATAPMLAGAERA